MRYDSRMQIGVWIKRKTLAVLPPLVLLGVGAFFGWSATQGDRGSSGYVARQEELRAAQIQQSRANVELVAWERRVASLRDRRLDLDVLDERVRSMLNLSEANDIVVMYPSRQKLF